MAQECLEADETIRAAVTNILGHLSGLWRSSPHPSPNHFPLLCFTQVVSITQCLKAPTPPFPRVNVAVFTKHLFS